MAKVMYLNKRTYQCTPTSAHAQQHFITMAVVSNGFVHKPEGKSMQRLYALCDAQMTSRDV